MGRNKMIITKEFVPEALSFVVSTVAATVLSFFAPAVWLVAGLGWAVILYITIKRFIGA